MTAPSQLLGRRARIAAAVLALHAAALYALQSGLLQRAVQVVVPAEVLAVLVEPAQPLAQPPAPPARTQPQPPATRPAPRPAPPPPLPVAAVVAEPSPQAPTGATTPQPPAPPLPPLAAPAPAASVAPAAPAAQPRIQLPDSAADYLHNRPPAYPPLSRRLGEQGKVVVRVFIDTDGTAKDAELRTSSGYDRLDQAALKTVLAWRYVAGKVNGEARAMWFNVPIHFVLE